MRRHVARQAAPEPPFTSPDPYLGILSSLETLCHNPLTATLIRSFNEGTEHATPRVRPRVQSHAGAAAAVCGQRLRGFDLRNRLAAIAPACHRFLSRFTGRAARNVHGRHVPGQPGSGPNHPRAGPSLARLCPSGRQHGGAGPGGFICRACHRPSLRPSCRAWSDGDSAARRGGFGLFAPAHFVDGRNLARCFPMGGNHRPRHVLAGPFLRRKYAGSRHWMSARRILPPPQIRHGRRHRRRRRHQCGGGVDGAGSGVANGAPPQDTGGDRGRLRARRKSRLCDNRAVWILRIGRRSHLDTVALADARGDGVCVFDHTGGVFGRAGTWQHGRVASGEGLRAAASGVGLVSNAAGGGDGVGGVHVDQFGALLASQPFAGCQPMVHLPA